MSSKLTPLDDRYAQVTERTTVFGKPNIFVRSSPEIQQTLERDPEDEMRLHELLGADAVHAQDGDMEKMLVQLKEADENFETEYGASRIKRHAIADRAGRVIDDEPDPYNKNEAGALQVINFISPSQDARSYYTLAKKSNNKKMTRSMQGMDAFNNLCFLKVTSKSQLKKEIEETKDMPEKILDFQALYRNE